MTLPYLARLVCLCLSAFFVLHAAVALVAWMVSPAVLRYAGKIRARTAERLLIGLRLLPAGLAGLVIAGLCAPSYLWFEPRGDTEEIGPVCLIAALAGACVLSTGMLRAGIAALRSTTYLRSLRQSDGPVLLLAGVFRPRVVLSNRVREALTPEEFEVALEHEQAHASERDNLKRLAILMAPDVFPLIRGFRTLDAGWRRAAEWAADDDAVQGSPRRALALASALVRVSRLGSGAALPALSTSLLADTNDLRTRVDRLIDPRPAKEFLRGRFLLVAASALAAALLAFVPLFETVHEMWESLAH